MSKRTVIKGELQIDHDRGVVYFHDDESGMCLLRIGNLPKPITDLGNPPVRDRGLDITHLVGQDWNGTVTIRAGDASTWRRDLVLAELPQGENNADSLTVLER